MNRKIVWNSIFFLGAVGLGIGLSIKPWQVYRLQRKQADVASAEMRATEQERVELTRKKAQYDSELGKEELARNQGYRQKDENPVESKLQGND